MSAIICKGCLFISSFIFSVNNGGISGEICSRSMSCLKSSLTIYIIRIRLFNFPNEHFYFVSDEIENFIESN